MTRETIFTLSKDVQQGGISPENALGQLADLPFEDAEFAKIDHHRTLRLGLPEVIFAAGKTRAKWRRFFCGWQTVAEEAAVTAEFLGTQVERVYDVGVAGLHRLLAQLETLQQVQVAIVRAGMEGALPSVVGGLVGAPVIAVPTSVGYGASFGGVAALLGMLIGNLTVFWQGLSPAFFVPAEAVL
jgi:NCAIR mutase (PurE)-related protein